ncbi:B- and T-lymphocyte attenuator isoform X7 [Lates calcarifer]|uniref:B- and T-lymphocyte attenuator isoform X7 n=1 Tax=Lates calcarifer TaxID=8187 RepID=A0AAJ7Q3W1_LATCA|nr:B- and T-lymphocyte attenuator isoform X7 [Lates calcarifer]
MTGAFHSVPIMRPYYCWTVLYVSILAALVLTLNADSKTSECETSIKVRRNTVYQAFVGQDLRINCTVSFCNNTQPVSWFKLENGTDSVSVNKNSHIKTEWKPSDHLEGTSYLIFQKILSNDSGVYRCRSGGSVSHNINILVSASTTSSPEPRENLLMYVYCASGILAFVMIVIVISVISMQGCKGKSKKETQTENQYIAIPMVEQPFQDVGLQPAPRESPSAPPPRRSTRRKAAPSQLPRNNERVCDGIKENRERQRNVEEEEEEGSSVVYAALNHQLPPGAAARPWRPQEEFSEYAAIRVS